MRVPLLATHPLAVATLLLSLRPIHAAGQTRLAPVTRDEAIAAALTRGARLAVARADTAAALAQLVGARALPNPTLSASYSKSTPNYHATVELPLDYFQLRRGRVGAALASRRASQYRFAFERAMVALEADTTYTRTRAAYDLARLSQRNARDADSLLTIAIARREAGDASELDVELARVSAGQAANVAATDSLTFLSSVLDLQGVMGLADDGATVLPVDSLTAPPEPEVAGDTIVRLARAPLPVAAAEASLESARLIAGVAHRSIFLAPVIVAGFETGDPTGSETGVLPTVGVALPLPFLDRNRGAIAGAEAERERARAELALAAVQSRVEIARARRERAIAYGKVARDRRLVTSAQRVAAMALTAYREGASPLPNVLEAQRSARDVLAQYVTDLADAWIAAAELRVLVLTPENAP